ncbi:MAG: ribosome rescue protein RqcH [Promethearchaeia archaeon]
MEISNFDVFALAKELNELLANGIIDNVYQVEDILIIRINTGDGKKDLIVKKDSRINITEYEYPIPSYPSQFVQSIRKKVNNRKILEISQYGLDRIIVIRLSNYGNEPWKFVIELFGKGNFILMDEENTVKVAKSYKKFRSREILANKEYQFPKSYGRNFLKLDLEELRELFEENEGEIVRIMARKINIAGVYSEEICFRAGVDKITLAENLTEDQIKQLYKSLKDIRNQLLFGEIKANIVLDDEGDPKIVLPFELEKFKDYSKEYFDTFNEAVDVFFSKIDSKSLNKPSDNKVQKKIQAQKKILKNQKDYINELEESKENYYRHGDFIYAHFNSLQNLLNVISEARKKGYNWDDIETKMEFAKQENMKGAQYFKKLIPAKKQVVIEINGDEVYLSLSKSIGENASIIYARGKKTAQKLKGTKDAIKKTEQKIEKLQKKEELEKDEVDFLVKKPEKKWYEKYHSFFSSEGFLVVGGRDASSNEAIYRKYIEKNDLVFHTDFPGSPLAVVKNAEDDNIPEQTIKETAQFVASYSIAWKECWGYADVFYVTPDQISKNPPSGEYLKKGSFMITGKKEFIRHVKTELEIGLKFAEIENRPTDDQEIYYPKVICGPDSAIKKLSDISLILKPSNTGLSKGKLAKKIKRQFLKQVEKDMEKWVEILSLDDIILELPNGNSIIKNYG